MSEPVWTLLAVIVGGLLSVGGAVLADHLKTRRDEQRAARDHLRDNLYTLLDDLRAVLDTARFGELSTIGDFSVFENAVTKALLQTIKIGDHSLEEAVRPWIENIRSDVYLGVGIRDEVHGEDTPRVQTRDDERGMAEMMARIYELLHTDEKVVTWLDVHVRGQTTSDT